MGEPGGMRDVFSVRYVVLEERKKERQKKAKSGSGTAAAEAEASPRPARCKAAPSQEPDGPVWLVGGND